MLTSIRCFCLPLATHPSLQMKKSRWAILATFSSMWCYLRLPQQQTPNILHTFTEVLFCVGLFKFVFVLRSWPPKWTLLPLKWALEEKQNIFSIVLTKYTACLFLLNSRSANFLVVLSYKNWNERNMYIWKYFRPLWISSYFSHHL